MNGGQHKEARAAHALRVITAMDRRAQQGTCDEKSEQALLEAEATIRGMRAIDLLQAFRSWRDCGVQSFDPTGGPVRVGNYLDTAMRSRRHG